MISFSIQRVSLTVCEYSDSESDSESDSQSDSESRSPTRKRPRPPSADSSAHDAKKPKSLLDVEDEFSAAKNKKCEQCLNFLAGSKPPLLKISSEVRSDIKHICQLYQSQNRFASVYDKRFRIPLYSAYKIKADGFLSSATPTTVDSDVWKYEPQLEIGWQLPPEMMMSSKLKNTRKIDDIEIQPVEKDYVNSCLLYTSPSPRDQRGSRMPSSA